MKTVTVKKATENDRDSIAYAIAKCYEKEFIGLSKDTDKIIEALRAGIQISRFYVAFLENELIGITACSDCNGRAVHVDSAIYRKLFGIKGRITAFFLKKEFMHALPYSDTTGFIEFVGVLPQFQGNGYSKQILLEVIKQSGYKDYVLDLTDVNVAAYKCYKGLGFEETKRVKEKFGKQKGFKYRIYMEYKAFI